MLDKETKRRIDTARDILVGKVPDPKSQVEQITIALIYKFMDDMDAEAEELGGERKFFKGDFIKYGWSKLMSPAMGGFEVLNLYAEAITKMTENEGIPVLFRDIFKNAYLPYRDPETLKSFLKIIDDFEYDHSERLGDAFEYLLSVLGSQGDAGQFRTPRHIIDFMVAVIDPKKDESVLDPACGTAGFLISSWKHVLQANSKDGRKGAGLTPDERKRLTKNIKGYDISPDMVRLSLVNLYLHGFTDPHISEYETLTSEDNWNQYSDIILANPPFMSPKGGIKPHKRFSIQAKRSEVLFVDYIAEHLTPNGRAAVIVPEGIIFQSQNAYKQLRKMLVENYLYAVVSLPAGVFQPYSGVKTSILLIDKTLAKKCNSILFVKIVNDGFDLGAQRREIQKNDLPEAKQALHDFHQASIAGEAEAFNADQFPNVLKVEKEKIGENGEWNLSGERYRENDELRNTNYELVELGEVVSEIMTGFACGKARLDSLGKAHVRPMNITEKGQFTWKGTKFLPEDHKDIDRYFLKKNDVLFNNTNSKELVGKTCFVDRDSNCGFSNHITRIRVDSKIVAGRYISELLHTMWSKGVFLEMCNKWVGQAGINKTELSKIKIPLPPLKIQQEIVAEIEGYQKIIDGARAVVENYKPQIQINPEWEMVKLGDVLFVKGGYAFKSGDFIKAGTQVIKMGNVKKQHFDIENKPSFLPKEFKKKYKDYVLGEGDILISMTGTVGKTDYGNVSVIDPEGEFLLNQRVGKFKFRSENICDKKYIFHIANQDIFRDAIFRNSSGGVRQANISSKQIESIDIPLPPIETQKEIVAQIEKEQALVNANKELITLFDQKIKDKIASVWGEETLTKKAVSE